MSIKCNPYLPTVCETSIRPFDADHALLWQCELREAKNVQTNKCLHTSATVSRKQFRFQLFPCSYTLPLCHWQRAFHMLLSCRTSYWNTSSSRIIKGIKVLKSTIIISNCSVIISNIYFSKSPFVDGLTFPLDCSIIISNIYSIQYCLWHLHVIACSYTVNLCEYM